MDFPIAKILKDIGFTEGESKVYLSLIKLGTSTITPILNESGVSTSKVYLILEKLMKKGLVSMSVIEGKKHFTSSDPETLLDYFDEKKKEIEESEEKAKEMIKLLKLERNTKSKKPLMEMVKGKRGFKAVVREMIEEAEEGVPLNCLVAKRVSFSMQSLWKDFSIITDSKRIPQVSIYEHSTWYDKDPNIHKRWERKYLYPSVLPEKYSNLPYILNIGDTTLIADINGKNVESYIIRNKLLGDAFRKLLKIIRENAYVPDNAKKYNDTKNS